MALDPSSLRIGVVDQTNTGWVAAAVYSRTILSSLDQACNSAGVELFFLSGNSDRLPERLRAKRMRLAAADYLPAEKQLRRLLGIKEKSRALRGEARLRKLLRMRLRQASAATSARFAHLSEEEIDALIEEAREEAYQEMMRK